MNLEKYFDRLYPLWRNITGDGVRKTFDIMKEIMPLEVQEIPTGTKLLDDWVAPQEWKFNRAYISKDDYIYNVDHPLKIVQCSNPFEGELTKEELLEHIYSADETIPYVFDYYRDGWGFCMTDEEKAKLDDGMYQVKVDTELFDGSMTVADCVLKGETEEEIFITSYTCHPAMANNETTGLLVAMALYEELAKRKKRKYTYRFFFGPETLGAIYYLSKYGEHFKDRMTAGFVLNCLGGNKEESPINVKLSRNGNSLANRAVLGCLGFKGKTGLVQYYAFLPSEGASERQYCSPHFDLPVCNVARLRYETYLEYHTSSDNKDLINFEDLSETADFMVELCDSLEYNVRVGHNLMVEPMPTTFGSPPKGQLRTKLRNMIVFMLSMSGSDLLEVAERTYYSVKELREVAERTPYIDVRL